MQALSLCSANEMLLLLGNLCLRRGLRRCWSSFLIFAATCEVLSPSVSALGDLGLGTYSFGGAFFKLIFKKVDRLIPLPSLPCGICMLGSSETHLLAGP